MAYTSVSKTDEFTLVRVQLPPSALNFPLLVYKTSNYPFFGTAFGTNPVSILVISNPLATFSGVAWA